MPTLPRIHAIFACGLKIPVTCGYALFLSFLYFASCSVRLPRDSFILEIIGCVGGS
jgi:hypothetical protein